MTTGFARVAVSSGSGSFKVTYYGKDGVRVSGSRTIDGDSYYFDKTTGAMTTGFLRDPSGKGYSFHALDDGRKLTGEQPLHGGWRDFGADGFMEVGFGTAEQGGPSRKVYYDEYDGARASGETNVKGSWYYFNPTNGAMATGLTEVTTQQGGVKTALYGSDGKRKYGEQYLNGGWYYFDEADGHMLTGWKWLNNGDRMVYYGADGRMLHGTHVIDGYRRVFDNETGAVNKYGYQNPLGYYQVSTWNVWVPNYSGNPAFSYVSPSQIGLAADRWDCIETFISRAYDYMYTPYVWDYALAPGVGIDCAGLVMQALYATGMDLGSGYTPYDHYFTPGHDHYANDMAADPGFMTVPFSDRQRGDLIFYPGHVAIYLGDDLVIDSFPGNGYYGVAVRSMWHYDVNYIVKRPFV